jgi:hypothetical protein
MYVDMAIITNSINGGSTASVPFTVPASNARLLVVAHLNITSATYNGVALTAATGYYYLVNPPVGTFNIIFTGGSNVAYVAASFGDIDQASPIVSPIVTGGTTASGGSSASFSNSLTNAVITEWITFNGSHNLFGGRVVTPDFSSSNWNGGFLSGTQTTLSQMNAYNQGVFTGFSENSLAFGALTGFSSSAFVIGAGITFTGLGDNTVHSNNKAFFKNAEIAAVNYNAVSNKTYSSATINAVVVGTSPTSYVEYGTATGVYTTQLASTTLNTVTNNITGLTQNTVYYYRVVTNTPSYGTIQGAEQSFTTYLTPSVTTNSSTVTTTSLGFNSTYTNGNTSGTCFFQYGLTTGSYTTNTTPVAFIASTSASSCSETITGLATGVTIYYRAGITVDGVNYYGSEISATPSDAPLVILTNATVVSDTSIDLTGTVNPRALATTRTFNYGVSTALGTNTGAVAAGNGIVAIPVSATLIGLLPNTLYYYRLSANNANGISFTEIQSVRTYGAPSITSFSARDNVVYTDNVVTLVAVANAAAATYSLGLGTASGVYTTTYTGTVATSNTIPVTSLIANTTYYAKVTVTNVYGASDSSEIIFSTFNTNFKTPWTLSDAKPTTTWTNES